MAFSIASGLEGGGGGKALMAGPLFCSFPNTSWWFLQFKGERHAKKVQDALLKHCQQTGENMPKKKKLEAEKLANAAKLGNAALGVDECIDSSRIAHWQKEYLGNSGMNSIVQALAHERCRGKSVPEKA